MVEPIFHLRLGDDGSANNYFRLPPPTVNPYKLRFVISAGSVASLSPLLMTNMPLENNGFDRTSFSSLKFAHSPGSDHSLQIPVWRAGAYEFYVTYLDGKGSRIRSARDGAFVVDPLLSLNESSTVSLVPLDGITILTIIPKWMPTIDKWMPFFDQFSSTGYNMVHFAPINKRGISNSPYSINDQLSLSDDLFSQKMTEVVKEEQMGALIESIHRKNGIFCATDVVWNHTSCDSEWLQDHPEAGYNLKSAPYLRSAFELDSALMDFSSSFTDHPMLIVDEEGLDTLMKMFEETSFKNLALYEFYVLDIKSITGEFKTFWDKKGETTAPQDYFLDKTLSFRERAEIIKRKATIDNKSYMRFSKSLDLQDMAFYVQASCATFNLKDPYAEFTRIVQEINMLYYLEYDSDCKLILSQIKNRSRFLRLEENGPKLGAICLDDPLVDSYFTRLPLNEKTEKLHSDQMALACNGWIWNADPLVNFAGEESKAYLFREVIPWGDCVKLRYGDGPDDNPWLWSHQTAYTVKMATLFHGFRIDNCHSTPIHVAAYLLDKARHIRPNLYVFAELFTGSEATDILFVSKLGINSLIREAMNAWDPAELSRLVHKQGGSPIGSFTLEPYQLPLDILGHDLGSEYQAKDSKGEFIVNLKGSTPHVLFMDCTHDNETPTQKRTSADSLSSAALVAISACAIGSVKGYDEIVPKLLDVVGEKRKYRLPESSEGILPVKAVLYPLHSHMATMGYSEIHVNQENGYISVHRVHPITHDGYLLIARTAFNGQSSDIGTFYLTSAHSPIRLRNQHIELIQCATISVQGANEQKHVVAPTILTPTKLTPTILPESEPLQRRKTESYYHSRSPVDKVDIENGFAQQCSVKEGCINGLPSTLTLSNEESFLTSSKQELVAEMGVFDTIITVDAHKFVPGGFVLYRTWMSGCTIDPALDIVTLKTDTVLPDAAPGVLEELWSLLGLDDKKVGVEIMMQLGADILDSGIPWCGSPRARWPPGLKEAVRRLTAPELNVLLFRVTSEESQSAYDVPGYGSLAYAGLQGFVSAILPVARTNNLGHAICSNIRSGPWIFDFVIARLKKYAAYYPGLKLITEWLEARLQLVKKLPATFAPKYFAIVIMSAFEGAKHQALYGKHHSKKIPESAQILSPSTLDVFAYNCTLTAFQLYGSVKSTGLLPGPYPLPFKSPDQLTPIVPIKGISVPSLAAGLPHFSVDYCRCWGRDIFIALRGLLILPGNFEAARTHIIAFGSTLKHGLIPNLLDQGANPRYNARDAVWFWMDAVFSYVRDSPEGLDFLEASVARRFIPLKKYTNPQFGYEKPVPEVPDADNYLPPNDPRVYMHTSTIAQLCHEILERHAMGINFREWNAGAGIDHAMRNEGFNISVAVNAQTGFVQGGNRWNCGTWMDKMGDSEAAGIKGVPATPRDGSAIELVGLQKSCISFIANHLLKGKDTNFWPWRGVSCREEDGSTGFLLYSGWDEKIQSNFERSFYIPLTHPLDSSYAIDHPELVNRRGIYKDTFGSSTPFADYQMRPNACIAMVKAPELFDGDNCRNALLIMKDSLLGPLDPLDWAYRGTYDNNNDSSDATVAHGFNYHQGPEWVWMMGYFLRAYLLTEFHMNEIQRIIKCHKIFILDYVVNPYAGLPELTNKDGVFCNPSCPTQAWSTSVFIELVHDIRNI